MNWLVMVTVLLAGCAPTVTKSSLSQYLKACPIAEPKQFTTKEAVRVANERKQALEQCNKDKEKIRKIVGE